MIIHQDAELLKVNGRFVKVSEIKSNNLFIKDELSRTVNVEPQKYKYSGLIYEITTANKVYTIFEGTEILTSVGYVPIEKLKDLLIKKPSLMLVTPKMSTYGTISTYFSSNRVFDVTSYDVKDLECYTVYANELVVDALICVDKLK